MSNWSYITSLDSSGPYRGVSSLNIKPKRYIGDSFECGKNITYNGYYNTIIGTSSHVKGDHNTIIGSNNKVDGSFNTISGSNVRVTGSRNNVTGCNIRITGDGNVITGNNIRLKCDNSVYIKPDAIREIEKSLVNIFYKDVTSIIMCYISNI